MKTRTDLLNHLAKKHNLNRYLEIGVQVPALNFDKIDCKSKTGVDPNPAAMATFCTTSDDFFAKLINYRRNADIDMYVRAHELDNKSHNSIDNIVPLTFDLIFVDGLHVADQVAKDFVNASSVLCDCGFIVLHDCNPEKEEHTIVPRPTERGHWNGDVYKFAATVNKKHAYTVDIDNGCLVFQRNPRTPIVDKPRPQSWIDFEKNRKELLNLISWEEFVSL